MKFIVAFICVCIAVSALEAAKVDEEWANFKKLFERKFEAEEEAKRFEIFKKNHKFVQEQNEKFAKGESTWGAAINEFSDRTEQEKQQLHGLYVPTPAEIKTSKN